MGQMYCVSAVSGLVKKEVKCFYMEHRHKERVLLFIKFLNVIVFYADIL